MQKQLDDLPCEGRILAVVHSPNDLEADAPGLAVVLVQRDDDFVVWGTATGRGYFQGDYRRTLTEAWATFGERVDRHMKPHLARDANARHADELRGAGS